MKNSKSIPDGTLDALMAAMRNTVAARSEAQCLIADAERKCIAINAKLSTFAADESKVGRNGPRLVTDNRLEAHRAANEVIASLKYIEGQARELCSHLDSQLRLIAAMMSDLPNGETEP